MEIQYVKGDATRPIRDGFKIICHVCNNIGLWGKGFVLALSRRWREPEHAYREWLRSDIPSELWLGHIQMIQIEPDIWVINMIAQVGVRPERGVPSIRYGLLKDCLYSVRIAAKTWYVSVHMPRIGCGLAGGDWSLVEKIVQEELVGHRVPVTVYDLN